MNKNRLEAFSDAVLAIIITIMVLELKVAPDPVWQDYLDAYPLFISYALSFLFVGLYWSNHHNLFHNIEKINNTTLWLNMLGLFITSLIPFATATIGSSNFASIPVAVYALILGLSATVYLVQVIQLCRLHGQNSSFGKKFRGRFKTLFTIILNVIAASVSLLGYPMVAFAMLGFVAISWFIPNLRTK